jgi:hypothetical protein
LHGRQEINSWWAVPVFGSQALEGPCHPERAPAVGEVEGRDLLVVADRRSLAALGTTR